ncbi:APC family permease [Planosporangium sp. 12N6]|uniref:APC family permease n=1 Tax=Planosporangium spinosum TaxID=3402278 RepID=UPI003CEF7824
MSPPSPSDGPVIRPRPVSDVLAADRIGARGIYTIASGAVAPLTVVAGVVTTAWAVTGVVAIPLAFVLIAGLLAVFAVGYVAMARHITNAGAFYAFIARGLGRPTGVAAALVAWIAYNLLQVGLYGAFGPSAAALIADQTGVHLPWWLPALVAWLVTAILGVLRVDLNSRVLAVLLAAEIAFVIGCDLVNLTHPAPDAYRHAGAAFAPSGLFGHGVGAGFAVAVTGYVGFELVAAFTEEARQAARSVRTAVFALLASMLALYAISAWAMTIAAGPAGVLDAAGTQGSDLLWTLAGDALGSHLVVDAGHVLFLTSLFAAMVSYHAAVARYTFALGRERVLPAVLGRTSARSSAPVPASLTQSALALVVIIGYAAAGWDPLVRLFFWLGTSGGFGVLLLLTATCAAVIGFFARRPRREPVTTRLVAPIAALAGLATVTVLALTNYATLLGVPAASPWRWAFPAMYGLAILTGLAWGLLLRATRRDTYYRIGLGPHAVTGRATTTLTGASA